MLKAFPPNCSSAQPALTDLTAPSPPAPSHQLYEYLTALRRTHLADPERCVQVPLPHSDVGMADAMPVCSIADNRGCHKGGVLGWGGSKRVGAAARGEHIRLLYCAWTLLWPVC